MEDRDGRVWFSRATPGASAQPRICYYKNGHLVEPQWHYTNASLNQHSYINVMAISRSGKLWGMDFYLRPVYFDTFTHAVTIYPSVTKEVKLNYDYTVNSLLIEGEDEFWISTALNGLFKYDKKQGKTIHYFYSRNPQSLPTNQLMNLIRDPDNNNILWMGSLGAGLIKFDKTTGRALHLLRVKVCRTIRFMLLLQIIMEYSGAAVTKAFFHLIQKAVSSEALPLKMAFPVMNLTVIIFLNYLMAESLLAE